MRQRRAPLPRLARSTQFLLALHFPSFPVAPGLALAALALLLDLLSLAVFDEHEEQLRLHDQLQQRPHLLRLRLHESHAIEVALPDSSLVDGSDEILVVAEQIDEEADKGVAQVVADVALELFFDALLLLLLPLVFLLLAQVEVGVERTQRLTRFLERDFERVQQGVGQI